MKYDGYSVKLLRDSKQIKAGNVGTAMTAVFEGETGSYTFELGVIGDITGEGSVNKRDMYELMDLLLGSISFNGVYSCAADIDGSDTVDARDLALLARMK